jgi:hypothetical protein
MTLDEIVADYIREYRPARQAEERFFSGLAGLAEAIGHAARPGGRKHPHQYRLPNALLDEADRRLQRLASELAQAADFAALHGLVERTIGPMRGIADLAVYDLAHRIGMHLGKAPELVYLHSGTKKGAAVLGFRGKTLDPRLLPPAFLRLTPAEIEDCLCTYKAQLGGDVVRARSSAAAARCAPETPRARPRC